MERAVDDSANTPSGGCGRSAPAGGYLTLSVAQVLMPWWLYENGAALANAPTGQRKLELLDVRIFFACAEMRERRRFAEEGREPRYELTELVGLVGGRGVGRVRAALKRLRDVGLIQWDGKTLELASSPEQLQVDDVSGFWELFGQVENNRRRVPVPRRIARFIAGGTSRAETATILAHLLRCCYLRGREVRPIGNCVAAWVEEVFGVHATRVKQARARLIRLGMFIEHVMPQWHRNRYGNRIEVNLEWRRPETSPQALPPAVVPGGGGESADGTTGTESRPPVEVLHNQSATALEGNRSLPSEGSKNQNPAGCAPRTATGVSEKKHQKAGAPQATARPSLVHVVEEDLRSTERLLVLHSEAIAAGLAPGGERGELEFVALAEHALGYATRNAPGLFAWLVKHGRFTFITQDDEDAARRRLRETRFGAEAKAAPPSRCDGVGSSPASEPAFAGSLLTELLAGVRRSLEREGAAKGKAGS